MLWAILLGIIAVVGTLLLAGLGIWAMFFSDNH